ncbi:MAG TPA: C4-type zinc ribbon domain-containing protein [Bacillota bacterium]|nr:C4-type zinc ribbon domain-containing protein [Bacillota bacterium]
MPEHDDLRRLLELQALDSELAAREAERLELEEARDLVEARASVRLREESLAALRDRQARLSREVAWAEKEAAELKRKSAELERRLYGGQVANPKELEQMRRKSEQLKQELSSLDDGALAAMEELEALKPAMGVEEREAAAARSALNDREGAHGARKAEVDAVLSSLPARRQALAAAIEPGLLAEYERVRVRRGGVGVVALGKGICGGCRVTVPPMLLSKARQGLPVKCESCGRILCWVD